MGVIRRHVSSDGEWLWNPNNVQRPFMMEVERCPVPSCSDLACSDLGFGVLLTYPRGSRVWEVSFAQ